MNSENSRYISQIGAAAALRYCGITVSALWDQEKKRVVWEVPSDDETLKALWAYQEKTLTGPLAVFSGIHHQTYKEMMRLVKKYGRGV